MYPFFRSFRFSFLLSCIGVETNVSVKREKKNRREAEKGSATVNRNYHDFRFVVVSRGFKGICLGPVGSFSSRGGKRGKKRGGVLFEGTVLWMATLSVVSLVTM